MRGSHPGSFEVAHALTQGQHWDHAADTGEHYDLVVVGAGISGLAASYFFQNDAGRGTRVLVLDNHDDFGGHAKRNEFHYNGHTCCSTAARRTSNGSISTARLPARC